MEDPVMTAQRKKALTPLGETEMEVLHHVWALGDASVSQVRDRILRERKVAYTTIMTVMKNLADKGFLKYRKQGASYIYSAAIAPEHVKKNLIDKLVENAFNGSPGELVLALVKSESLSGDELRSIRELINKMEE